MEDKKRFRPWEKTPGRRNKPKPIKRQWGDSSQYQDSRWRSLSKRMRLNQPVCMKCDIRPCDVLDHIVSLRHGGAKYDRRNLWTLCHECHNQKTRKEINGPIFKNYYSERGDLVAAWSNGRPVLKPNVRY